MSNPRDGEFREREKNMFTEFRNPDVVNQFAEPLNDVEIFQQHYKLPSTHEYTKKEYWVGTQNTGSFHYINLRRIQSTCETGA